jgi:hypothetical protein
VKRLHVHPGAHDRPQGRIENDSGKRAAFEERRRQAGRAHATAIDDHVDLNVGQPVEGFNQVFPHRTKMHCAAGSSEPWQEEPSSLLFS